MPENLQSLGQKLHLMRLSIGWSEQECAYRLTLQANELITTATWLAWEKSGTNDPENEEILRLADSICGLFATDKSWFLDETITTNPRAQILSLNNP